MKAEAEEIITALRELNYVADEDIAHALFLADLLNKPLLIEGEAGVGKTEIARVLTKLKNTQLVRMQCYEGLDFSSALYEWNYQKQIVSLRFNELKNNTEVSLEDLYNEDYLLQRPILRALMAPQRVVLLLDEVDRADEEFEALLLETLAEYQLTIPEIGTLKARHIPYVILTSNRTRELTDALRRRCLYLWIGYPSFEKELAVIQMNVPQMSPALAMKVTSFTQALRREKLNKVPGLSEVVDWAKALQAGGVLNLDQGSINFSLGCLLKDHDDIRVFKSTIARSVMERPVKSASENLAATTCFTLRICETLRRRGVDIGLQQSISCLEAIAQYKAIDKDDLKRIYRTTLVNRKQDLWALHLAFEDVLGDHLKPHTEPEEEPEALNRLQPQRSRRQFSEDYMEALSDPESAAMEGYSVQEVDHNRDFRFISRMDAPAILAELRKIAKQQATLARRKFKRTNKHRGRIDMRASIRQTVKFDGEVLDWRFKRKLPSRSRFLIIADVSGSMEVYCLFLLNFLHHLNSSRHMKIESFVFSTRLERLTREFSTRNFREMLRKITETFSGWSGGTKIGAAIAALNENYGSLVTPKTSVLIMSDGWDTGDTVLLDQEMDRLRRRAQSIIWINPLKGAATYEPLAQGMAAALPYCDRLIAGHSLHSLEKLAAILAA